MNISIVIICYNEEQNIRECLNSILKMSYTLGKYEIVVVDSDSKDNTQNIIKEFTAKYKSIKFINEPKRGAASARNTGIKKAQYEYIAFTDADCEVPIDWLTILVENYKNYKLKDTSIIAVGGRNISPENAGNFTKAIEVALDSFIGSFTSIQGRQFKEPVYVSSLSTVNVLYEKQKLIEIGFLDETLKSEAEDAELNYRLFSKGNKFIFLPDSFVWHKFRSSPKLWWRNMFRYGKGRARLLKRYPEMWTTAYILPIIFIITMGTIIFIPVSQIFILPFLYFPGIIIYSFFHCLKKKRITFLFFVIYIYIIQHFGYAAGEIYGLLNRNIQ